MKKIVLWALCAMLALCACGEELPPGQGMPSQAGLDAASALVGLHAAVMRDVLGSDFCFSQLAGGSEFYVLFADEAKKDYLMVSLAEDDRDRAEMAVLQTGFLSEFLDNLLPSLDALTLPFLSEAEQERYTAWRDRCKQEILERLRTDGDYELNYFAGEYLNCALSVYHDETGVLFTALADWAYPMSADDISALMQAQ